MRICGKAVEIDPYYADAWALLAMAQSTLRYGYGREVDDGFAAAHTALSIDPALAEAHYAMARRLEENGQLEEALAELQKGLSLNPESWELNKGLANFFMRRGNFDDATPHFEKAASLMDSDYHAWGMLLTCYSGSDDTSRLADVAKATFERVEQVLSEDPSNGAALSFGVAALAALGERERAREWMERALLVDPDNLNMRYNFACSLAKDLDDREGAIRMLESAVPKIKGSIGNIEFDPDLASIRDDPRFQEMLRAARERQRTGGTVAAKASAPTPPTSG